MKATERTATSPGDGGHRSLEVLQLPHAHQGVEVDLVRDVADGMRVASSLQLRLQCEPFVTPLIRTDPALWRDVGAADDFPVGRTLR
jgi:hypothetical protein